MGIPLLNSRDLSYVRCTRGLRNRKLLNSVMKNCREKNNEVHFSMTFRGRERKVYFR